MKIDESRGNKYPFFPDYEHIITGVIEKGSPDPLVEIWVATTIRRQDRRGIWYFWDVIKETRVKVDTQANALDESRKLIKRLISECYKVITIGIVDTNIMRSNKDPIFKRDPNQESEQERLSRL